MHSSAIPDGIPSYPRCAHYIFLPRLITQYLIAHDLIPLDDIPNMLLPANLGDAAGLGGENAHHRAAGSDILYVLLDLRAGGRRHLSG